ncbi:MAG: hypothetical protein LBS10_01930 [Gracilibacteraceae bacterium]|jgi:uncharacterized protein YhaN|nr:hypothetical protein [Gracilibacteraceae bacterium]
MAAKKSEAVSAEAQAIRDATAEQMKKRREQQARQNEAAAKRREEMKRRGIEMKQKIALNSIEMKRKQAVRKLSMNVKDPPDLVERKAEKILGKLDKQKRRLLDKNNKALAALRKKATAEQRRKAKMLQKEMRLDPEWQREQEEQKARAKEQVVQRKLAKARIAVERRTREQARKDEEKKKKLEAREEKRQQRLNPQWREEQKERRRLEKENKLQEKALKAQNKAEARQKKAEQKERLAEQKKEAQAKKRELAAQKREAAAQKREAKLSSRRQKKDPIWWEQEKERKEQAKQEARARKEQKRADKVRRQIAAIERRQAAREQGVEVREGFLAGKLLFLIVGVVLLGLLAGGGFAAYKVFLEAPPPEPVAEMWLTQQKMSGMTAVTQPEYFSGIVFERIFSRESYLPAKDALIAKLADFSYTVLDAGAQGRSAIVNISFQYYDLAAIMERIPEIFWRENYGPYVTQQATAQELEEAMVALIERELAALQNKQSATVAVHMDRTGRDWWISDLKTVNEQLLCVLTGAIFGPVTGTGAGLEAPTAEAAPPAESTAH